MAPTNEFLKGQVVGRLFGGNTTFTRPRSSYAEQRFIPMFTYSPRLFDGWAKIRASFEFDWTWGDANYGAGGNFGGAFGADQVNMQTQNLFVELRPDCRTCSSTPGCSASSTTSACPGTPSPTTC